MNLKSLLLSSDEKTVRVLRRVLSDLEIDVEHCSNATDAIKQITRHRFEGIIVDVANTEEAAGVLMAGKAAPVNKRALAIVLVESSIGMKGGFGMGAHFVLHKPFAVERAKASFRAVRALMKRERRGQMRVPVQVEVECFGSSNRFKAKTIDLCEGGMAIQLTGRVNKENELRFSLELPGLGEMLEIHGEVAWEGSDDQVGVRFKDATDDQRNMLRKWLKTQIPDFEQDDPPVACQVTDLSQFGCYLATTSPFPKGTRVTVSCKTDDGEVRAKGSVLVAHPEFGMGAEFLQNTPEQREQAKRLVEALRATGEASPEVQVDPEGLEIPAAGSHAASAVAKDALVDLFRHKSQVPVETFLQHLKQQRQSVGMSGRT